MLICSTKHRGREDTDLRGNLKGPWGESVQERHPLMHMELVELHSDNQYPLHNIQPHKQSIPVAAVLSMVLFQVWVGREEGVGPPHGTGPNKSMEREVERTKEFGDQDRVCCKGMVAHSRLPPHSSFLRLDEECPAHACVCTQTQEEREGLIPG